MQLSSMDLPCAALRDQAFRQFADAMPQLVWSAGPDGVTDYLNERWYELTGAPRGLTGDASWAPWIHPDDLDAVRRGWYGAVAAGAAATFEYRVRCRDGSCRWFSAHCVPGRDEQGRIVRWYGSAADIDDHKRLVATLTDREEKLRQITENTNEVFYMSDRSLQTMLYISPAYERVWGRSLQSLVENPLSWVEAIHEEDRAFVLEDTLARQARGEPIDHQYRILRPDGGQRWIRDRGYPVRDAAGEVVRFVGTATDITDLKQVEHGLRLLQELSRDVMEAAHPAGAFEVVLGALCGSIGWSVGEAWVPQAGGEQLELAASAGSGGAALADFQAASKGRRFARGEGLPGRVWATQRSAWVADVTQDPGFPRAAAAERAGLRTGVAVPVLAGGEVVAVLEFFSFERRDEDPRLLQLLTSISAQLGAVIRRKLAEEALGRAEAQLRQAQKMEAVGRLAGGVAHDFNNLLTAILGYGELLAERLDARDPLQRHVEQIRKAGQRAASLTKQLLVFSRNERVTPQVLCPNAVVGDLDKLLRRLIGEDIELRTALAPGVGRVKVDKGYLEQVVLNLCVNARDAMPHGGRLLLATSEVELDASSRMARSVVPGPGRYVCIEVSDGGCGMTPEVLTHLFEPFFTTKEVGKGTGLGLSTVYGIVAGAQGHIAVWSEPGVGTSFKVYLPRAEEGPAQPPTPAGGVCLGRGTETVLLVEDDEMVRGLTRGVLESRGYEVLEVANGGEALLVCEQRQGPIDLVVTDVVMPGLSGPDLVRRLDVVRPGMKVLYCSGYTSGAAQHVEAQGSGRAFLQKPFAPDALARKVREVLDGVPASPG